MDFAVGNKVRMPTGRVGTIDELYTKSERAYAWVAVDVLDGAPRERAACYLDELVLVGGDDAGGDPTL